MAVTFLDDDPKEGGGVTFLDEEPEAGSGVTFLDEPPQMPTEIMSEAMRTTGAALTGLEMLKLPYQLDWSAVNEQRRTDALAKQDATIAAFGKAEEAFRASGGTYADRMADDNLLALEDAMIQAKAEYAATLPETVPSYEEFAKSGGDEPAYSKQFGIRPDQNEWEKGEIAAGRMKAPGFLETATAQFASGGMATAADIAKTVAPSFGTAELGQNLQRASAEDAQIAGLNQGASGDIARGVGTVAGLYPGTSFSKVKALENLPEIWTKRTIPVLEGAYKAAAHARSQAIANGEDPDAAGMKAFGQMALFLAGGALASKAGAAAVGPEASALKQGIAGGVANTGANIGMSAAMSGGDYDLENLTADVLFGGLGGLHAHNAARAQENLRQLSPEESRIVATQGVDALNVERPLEGAQFIDALPTQIREPSAPVSLGGSGAERPSLEQIRAEGVVPPDPNRELGPGAANIEEFGPQKVIGAKNASVDAQRAERGLEPLMSEARKSDPTTWDSAEQAIEANPRLPETLTRDILDGTKKSVNDVEQSALLWRMIDLRNSRDMEAERAKDPSLTPDEQAEHLAKFESFEKDLQLTEEADRKIGTQSGRALRIRRLMANDDFTLSTMEARERAAKGEPLTVEETQRIKAEHDEIARLAKEQWKREAQLELEAERKAVEEKIAEVGQYSPGLLERARKWIEAKEAKLEAGSKRMRELLGKMTIKANANPVEGLKAATEAIGILANEALVKLGRKGIDFAEFATEKIAEYGEAVRPLLQRAWAAAMREWDGSPAKPRKKTALQEKESKDSQKTIPALEGAIKETAGDKPTVASLSKQIKELGREYVKSGHDTIEKLGDKLHDFFKILIPGVEKRDLLTEYADFGKGKPAPTEPLRVRLSQLRGEIQKYLGLEVLEKQLAGEMKKIGIPPSGDKRVELSDRARQLIAQINDAKKKLGPLESDSAKRLSSTLESIQKRLENRIKDLRYEIAKGERSVKSKTAAPTNERIEALRKELEAAQAEHESVFGKRQMSEESKKRTAIASAERSLKAAEAELSDAKRGKFREPLKKGVSKYEEVRKLQAKADAVRGELSEIKDAIAAQQRPASDAQRRLDAALNQKERWQRVLAGEETPSKKESLESLTQLEEDARLEIASMRALAGELRAEQRRKANEPTEQDKAQEQLNRLLVQRERINQMLRGDIAPETKTTPEMLTQEAENVRLEIEAMQRALREQRRPPKDPGIAAEEAQIRALEKAAAEFERKLTESDFAKKGKVQTVDSARVAKARALRDAAFKAYEAAKDAANPKPTEEQVAISRKKKQLQRQIEDTRKRIESEDFEARKRKPPLDISKDPELQKLTAEKERIQNEFKSRQRAAERAKWSKAKKVWEATKSVADASANLATSIDLSALRQGIFAAVARPITAVKNIGQMIKAFASENAARQSEAEINLRENSKNGLYKKAGLELTPIDETSFTAAEENMGSRLAEKIPGVRASNRAFKTFLNRMRADMFDAIAGMKDTTPTDAELKALGHFVNVANGRGNFGKYQGAVPLLGRVYWSPRLLLSRIQLLLGEPAWRGSGWTRKVIAKEYGKYLAGMTALYGAVQLAKMAGQDDWDVGTDPRSADFGKVVVGNTRVDPLGGLAQVMTLAGRLAAGETKDTQGNVKDKAAGEVLGSFNRSKLSPAVGTLWDIVSRKQYLGQPTTIGSVARNFFVPLSLRDLPDDIKQEGLAKALAIWVANIFGISTRAYTR